jgi:putative transposase
LAGEGHACRIEIVLTPFFMCCERAGSRQALDQTELWAYSTAHDRFQEWVQAGVFLKLWQAGVERFEELCGIDWEWLSMMGRCGIRSLRRGKNRPQSHRSGQERRETPPAHRGHGVPIGMAALGANRHDMKLVRPTIQSIIIEREDADRGAAARDVSGVMVQRGGRTLHLTEIRLHRPYSSQWRRGQGIKKEAWFKARRWVVKRVHSWLNRFRRLLGRWEKKPQNYLAFLHFACGLIANLAAGLSCPL